MPRGLMLPLAAFPGVDSCCGGERAKIRCLDNSNMCKNSADFLPDAEVVAQQPGRLGWPSHSIAPTVPWIHEEKDWVWPSRNTTCARVDAAIAWSSLRHGMGKLNWDDLTCEDITAVPSSMETAWIHGNIIHGNSIAPTSHLPWLFAYGSTCCGGERARVRCLDNSNMCKSDADFLPEVASGETVKISTHDLCEWWGHTETTCLAVRSD